MRYHEIGHLSWGQNILLISTATDQDARDFYIKKAIDKGWTLTVLWDTISSNAYETKMQKILLHTSKTKKHYFRQTF